MFLPAHLIHCLNHMVHDVETIKDDFAAGVRHTLDGGLYIRSPHIHGDCFDGRQLLGAQALPEGFLSERRSSATCSTVAFSKSQTTVMYLCPFLNAFSSTPITGSGRCRFRAKPRRTARCMTPQTSSQLSRKRRQAPRTVAHCWRTSITKRSMRMVNRDRASAQGIATCNTPCSGHSTRGIRA